MGFWVAMLFYAAMMVLTEVTTPLPEQEDAKVGGLGDIRLPTTTERRKVPLIWGTVQLTGSNLIWYGDVNIWPVTTKVKSALGLKSKQVVTGYRYYISPQYGLCRGEVDSLLRYWVDDDLLYDSNDVALPEITHGDTMSISEEYLYGGQNAGGGYIGDFEFFAGTADQAASTYLTTFQAVGGDPIAYRGTCYLAPKSASIYVGTTLRLRNPKIEVSRLQSADANGLSLADPTVNTYDANPANVLYEVLTNSEWGLRISVGEIDVASFTTAAATLATEGNGFSFVLDTAEDVPRMIERVENQIDGAIYQDGTTGLWSLKLARDDYDVATITSFDVTNIVSIESFGRLTWEDTKNEVSAAIVIREDEYSETFAMAQDMANITIQGDVVKPMEVAFPGVTNAELGNALAWRELRSASYPMAHAKIVTDRTTYATTPVDVVKLSFTRGGFSVNDLVMRVKSIDGGDPLDGKITYELVEDIYFHIAGSFDAPDGSLWVPPPSEPTAIPADEQLIIPAPRLIAAGVEASEAELDDSAMLFAARRQSYVDLSFDAYRSSVVGANDFNWIGRSDFCLMGTLKNDLLRGTATPTTTVTLDASLDPQARILEYFPHDLSEEQVGTGYATLIVIGDEFILPMTAVAGTGAEVDFGDVYRGVMDTVQGDHLAGAKVFLLYVAALTESGVSKSASHDYLLLPVSNGTAVGVGGATIVTAANDYRSFRAIPPCEMSLDGSRFATTISLEAGGATETDGIPLTFIRRSRTQDDTIAALKAEESIPVTGLTHDLDVIDKPDTLQTLLFNQSLGSTNSAEITRLDILKANSGVLPTRLRFSIRAHVVGNAAFPAYYSRHNLTWDFDVTSALTGDFAFGALDTNDVSNAYTVGVAGVHAFTLSSAFIVGAVQYRVDAGGGFGSWLTLIAAAATTGSTTSLSASDIIEVRHQSTDVGAQKLLTMNAAGAGNDGFAVLFV